MNYIYDITLNFNKNNLYEFYEWREDDVPEFILKIPIYKIDKNAFFDIKNNNIIVDKDFLITIFDKTEVYTEDAISLIRYAALFSDGNNVIGIEFDSSGNSYMKSNLSIDDESEVLEIIKDIKYTLLDYKVKNINNLQIKLLTRKEKEEEEYLLNRVNSMYKNNETEKLKYIFYELYNEKLDNLEKVYSKLIKAVKNNDSRVKRLLEIISLMENKKIVTNNS